MINRSTNAANNFISKRVKEIRRLYGATSSGGRSSNSLSDAVFMDTGFAHWFYLLVKIKPGFKSWVSGLSRDLTKVIRPTGVASIMEVGALQNRPADHELVNQLELAYLLYLIGNQGNRQDPNLASGLVASTREWMGKSPGDRDWETSSN